MEKQVHEVREAIATILSDRKSYNTSLNYAVNYCEYALSIPTDKPEDLKVQCLYILNNLSGWRHPKAKEVRNTLKRFAGLKR